MRNLWMAAGLLLGTVAFTSCDSGTKETDSNTTVDTAASDTPVADVSLTDEKREFMAYAYNISNQQVELGKLAVEKGLSPQVKEYGQRMIDLYGKKLEELGEMSGQYQVTLPETMTEDQAGRVQELRETETGKFDRAYWDNVIDAHKDAADEFDDNVKDVAETDNTAFNFWARNTAKEIRAHMEQAMRFRLDLKN
ncbi:DUF4142 domain-containing protein [Pontibacter sp. JH31]|uniref:DUF4142 domain-containing protein n=1 Tax=Pontibacter aquaedesilientis TaxID=2766980 RepID=A0ABR7XFU6_9BACT|nr:DUF4142 domain-containing protein [Pontibacter aquaedesilientis]MBD1396811.1 DUF4142 domain-containing protein [Pontibacter aquaedesilientis]